MALPGAQYYIGVDVGGTNTKAGLVSDDGKLVATLSRPTPTTQEAVLSELCAIVEALGVQALGAGVGRGCAEGAGPGVPASPPPHVRAVGVAVPGQVDSENGVAVQATNLPFHNLRIADGLSASSGLPVRLENDTDAGVLAELLFGQARGLQHVVYLAMGTGVGGGLVLNGQLYRGTGIAGEIGHMIVSVTGPMCGCGTRGCLEAYASGPAIVRLASESGSHAFSSAEEVFAAAAAANPAASRAIRLVGEALATVLLGVSRLLSPEMIVLGGGVAKAGAPLLAAVELGLKSIGGWGCAPIALTETPDWSGVLGAAAAAASHSA